MEKDKITISNPDTVVEFTKNNHGITRAGRSMIAICPECMSKSHHDQIWMEVVTADTTEFDQKGDAHPYFKVEGIAWCPCGCKFRYELTNRWDDTLQVQVGNVTHGTATVLQTGADSVK